MTATETLRTLPALSVADLSTAHMRSSDTDVLDSLADGILPLIAATRHGWLVYVQRTGGKDTPETIRNGLLRQGFSEEFCDVVEGARNEGFGYIMFDSDADTVEDLPEFDW